MLVYAMLRKIQALIASAKKDHALAAAVIDGVPLDDPCTWYLMRALLTPTRKKKPDDIIDEAADERRALISRVKMHPDVFKQIYETVVK
jgi:hypothetical protein